MKRQGARTMVVLPALLLITFAAAAVGGVFTPGAWYDALQKPQWNPPDWVFGPVWTVLYVLMAIAAWLVWRERARNRVTVPLAVYGIQLVLNAAWSWLFFGLQRPDLAAFEILALLAAIAATLITFWRVRPLAGVLLTPYIIWVAYATTLNVAIWQLN